METIISVVSASVVASVGCHCVPPCEVWLSLTGSGSGGRGGTQHHTCGTSLSPCAHQPWSRRVAVFCSHRTPSCCGELRSHCEGYDFMCCSPPPPPGSYWHDVHDTMTLFLSSLGVEWRPAPGLPWFSYLNGSWVLQGLNLLILLTKQQ